MKYVRMLMMGLLAGSLIFCFSGCVVVRKGAAKLVSPVATQLSTGLMYQSDVELVRDGAPAFLLMLDALAETHADNPAVLMAAADAQVAYATGFVDKANKSRTKAMYAKAQTFGLRALDLRNKRFAKARNGGTLDDFTAALRYFKKDDAAALYTTASAWVMWIIASSDSPAALGDMPKVLAMMARVQDLNPGIHQGGVDLFYGIYYTVLPLGGGRDLERARKCFERSMAFAGPDYLLPKVTFAEFYARYAYDQELFENTLREVLAAQPQAPEFTLMNAVAKTRAQTLLDQVDDLF